jgi:hypothetical protein
MTKGTRLEDKKVYGISISNRYYAMALANGVNIDGLIKMILDINAKRGDQVILIQKDLQKANEEIERLKKVILNAGLELPEEILNADVINGKNSEIAKGTEL